MLSLTKGRPIAKIIGGNYDGELLGLVMEHQRDEECCLCEDCGKKCRKRPCCKRCKVKLDSDEVSNLGDAIVLTEGKLIPLPNVDSRSVDFIAGPSGSGKSTCAVNLATIFKKVFPEKDIYLFSRTDFKNDPVFRDLHPIQIKIDESLLDKPIDITQELKGGALIIFDDCNTLQNDKLKKEIDKLMNDIMEIGRKLGIWIIITNHLVIPSEKKMARTVLNEMHTLTVFPKSGSAQQIRYCLKTYFGLPEKQIQEILNLPSRWVMINKSYPQFVIHEKGAYLI